MDYPWVRLRRLTRTPALRRLARSVRPSVEELLPYARIPVEDAGKVAEQLAERAVEAGYAGIYLAPTSRRRDSEGSEVWSSDAPLAEALTAARATAPELAIFAELDLAMFLRTGRPAPVSEGLVDAEAAQEAIGKAAVALAEAGADVIGLRGQVDGGVSALREALDEASLERVAILAFSVDLYSPLTELRPRSADRAADLLDPLDPGTLLRQAELDVGEGADLLGVQPCLLTHDIVRDLADEHQHPIVARLTDQETKVLEVAARSGVGELFDVAAAVHGSLVRAGARLVVTPWTFLKEGLG